MSIPEPGCDPEIASLVRDAVRGDAQALRALFDRYRERLKQMVALRLDRRLSARVDPSDIVQEALADASRKLEDYSAAPPLPFYPWLYCLTAERLTQAHRRHVHSQGRGVAREEQEAVVFSDGSTLLLVDRLISRDPTPATTLVREEQRRRLLVSLEELAETDRDVLVMRYLEGLSFSEIAAILGIGESAAKMRHLRALRRVREVMGAGRPESSG
jgi:RNA polymerase sigma-70 factor (ECF subfamily)